MQMTPALHSISRPLLKGFLRFAVIFVIFFCVLPSVSVVIAAVMGSTDTLGHLADTVLWRYIGNTLVLVALVMFGTAIIGTTTAWLVTMTEFAGRRLIEIALALPLAFPAYVLAYAYTHLLDHPGIVQTTLRDMTGWGPRDYWFPEVRSIGGAATMLCLLYTSPSPRDLSTSRMPSSA